VREKQKWKVSQQIPAHQTQIHSTSKTGIDTLCSRPMSDLKPYTRNNVKGIAGGLKIEATGIFVFFAIQDDSGVKDIIRIPNSLYFPVLELPLLPPQH
jgi:hypothetical protein